MSRSAAGTHGVNLMPLLDVLLCTMGTLIVILGVINREARLHPAKRLPGKSNAKAQQLEQMVEAQEDLQLRIQELNAAKEKTLADLENSRTRLAGVEDSSRHLEDQLQSLADAAKQLPGSNASDDPQREKLRLELTQLNQRRMQLEIDLQKARANSTRRQPGYAVIPFDEMYKTSRRPIYIECRGDSVILQPEGIVFGPQDFLGPGGPSNPLASALRAAQEYWRNAPRPAPDMPNEPYPLLLVRPNGIIGYYLVRDAMSSWDAEFGYELVGEDWKLEYPNQPDPQLQEMENRAVAEARQQLQWLAQVSPELFSRKASKVEYHVSPFRGGIVRDGGPSLGNDPFAEDPLGGFGRGGRNGNSAMPGMVGGPGGNPGNGVGVGSGNGFGGPSDMGGLADARGNSAFAADTIGGNGTGQGGMGPGGSYSAGMSGPGGSGAVGGASGGNSGPDVAGVGPRYAGTGNGTAGFGNDGGNIGGGTNTGGSGSVGGNSGDGTSGGSGNMVGGSGGASSNSSQLAGGGNPNYGNGGGGAGGGNSAQPGNGSNPSNGITNSASSAANTFRGMPGSGGSPSQYGGVLLPNSAGGMMSASSSSARSSGESGSAGSSMGTANGQYAGSAGQYSGGAGGGGSPYGSSSPTGGAGGGSGTSSGGDSSGGGSAGAASSAMGSSGGGSGSSGGGPSMTFDFSQQQQQNAAAYDDSTQQQSSSSHSMSKNRGKNWALPTSHTASVPVQRPIRVECWSDRLVLVPDTRDQQPQVISLGERTEDAIEPLVGAVRTYTRSWGIAGRSMYWKPQLVLNVNPNAEARAADLQTLLADSGWDVKRK